MPAHPKRILYTIICCCCVLLTSCTSASTPKANGKSPVHNATATRSVSKVSPTPGPPPNYTAQTLLRGVGRPDDLILDKQGQLLFTDSFNGTIGRMNGDGTTTTLVQGLGEPEGLAVLPDGTLIIAEQKFHRIDALAPGATTPTVLRNLPGTPSKAHCKDGVDGVAYDPTTNTIIVPDSPTGEVYRMSTDGKTLTLIAQGITRPVGGWVDAQGNIYVADECGGAVWLIAPDGKTTRFGGFGMPDDVALDAHGDLIVIDLEPDIHALIRMNLTTQQHETLASDGYIEPQGLVVDQQENIYVADDYANVIVKYTPA